MTFAPPDLTLDDREGTPEGRDPADLRTLLRQIREQLGWEEKRWTFGAVEKNEHADTPRIQWLETGGSISHDAPRYTGGERGQLAIDVCSFVVTIWHRDERQCRATLHDLYRACRDALDGPNFSFGAYEWIGDANVNRGRKLAVPVDLYLPIYAEPVVPTARVEIHDATITADTGGDEPEVVAHIVWTAPEPEPEPDP